MDIEQLYKEYFSIVYKYVYSLSGDSLISEEITQETFFKALRNINSFRGETSIRVWLCQIAKNAWYDLLKKQSKQTELPEESEEVSYRFEEELINKADAMEIHKALHNLNDPYKEVFSLRIFGELSFSDIAELFGKTESWARVTFHRAKLMIRKELEND